MKNNGEGLLGSKKLPEKGIKHYLVNLSTM